MKPATLTPRERAIVPLVADGKTNKEIARDLGMSPLTVRDHVSRLLDKCGVERRQEIKLRLTAEPCIERRKERRRQALLTDSGALLDAIIDHCEMHTLIGDLIDAHRTPVRAGTSLPDQASARFFQVEEVFDRTIDYILTTEQALGRFERHYDDEED